MAPHANGDKDLETGNPNGERVTWNPQYDDGSDEKGGGTDEYSNLVRYISTYREGRRKSTASSLGYTDDEGKEKKHPWWKFWSKSSGPSGTFEVPDEWHDTPMQGLSGSEVENRRRRTGWNELTTEKENMFLKFLSYFTGPILYSELILRCLAFIGMC